MNNLTDNFEYSLQQHYAAAQLLSNSSNDSPNNQQQQQQQQQQQDPNAFHLNYSSFPLIRMAPPQLHQPTLAKDLAPPSPQHQQSQTVIHEQVQLNQSHNNTVLHNSSNESHASSMASAVASPALASSQNSSHTTNKEIPIRVTRPPNAYLLFNKEMRRILKDQHPTIKVAEISKEIGSRWKNMPKEQKDQYVKQANKLKEEQRALHPNSMYIRRSRAELVKAGVKRSSSTTTEDAGNSQPSSPTVDLYTFLLTNNSVKKPSTPKKATMKKAKKNIPKHPLSAYMWYLTEVRPETMQQFPGSNVGQISKLCADRWNTMSEEARLPWKSKAQLDKERYAREMQIYALQNDHHLGRGTREKYRISNSSPASVVVNNHAMATVTTATTPDYAHQTSMFYGATTPTGAGSGGGHNNSDKLYHHHHHHHHHLSTPTSPTSILRNTHASNHHPMTLNPNALLQTHGDNATDPYS